MSSADAEVEDLTASTKKFMKRFNMPREEKLVNCECTDNNMSDGMCVCVCACVCVHAYIIHVCVCVCVRAKCMMIRLLVLYILIILN